MMDSPRLVILGITRGDELKFKTIPGSELVQIESVGDLDKSKYGELVTLIAVVTLSSMALKVLALWLAKTRSDETVTFSTELQHLDGKRERRTITLRRYKTEAPETS